MWLNWDSVDQLRGLWCLPDASHHDGPTVHIVTNFITIIIIHKVFTKKVLFTPKRRFSKICYKVSLCDGEKT